jgi:hypothetical protein
MTFLGRVNITSESSQELKCRSTHFLAEATRVKASAPFSRKSRGTVFSIVGAMCMPTEHSILMFLGRVTADAKGKKQNSDRAVSCQKE